jgi:hypothetical protein
MMSFPEMKSGLVNEFRLDESQGLVLIPDEIQGNDIAGEITGTAAVDALEASPEPERENSIPTPVPTQFPMMVSNEATEVDIGVTTKPKQRRNTKSFSKKMHYCC